MTDESKKRFFICLAVSKYLALERALTAIIQMLLIMSGIETNPGPATENSGPCCNASQHFNRVKNSIKKNKNNFQSKIVPGSLSKKVIAVEETGGKILHFQKFHVFIMLSRWTCVPEINRGPESQVPARVSN